MKSVDCVHVIQQKDTASSPSAPPGAASGTTGLFSVTFLWLAMLLSSCLAAVSLYHVLTLKTELEALRHELIYRVQARSPLERRAVSPDDEKAGAPVSSFLQASAAGARQVSWSGGCGSQGSSLQGTRPLSPTAACPRQENELPGPSPAESFQKEISNGSRNRGRRSAVHTEETGKQHLAKWVGMLQVDAFGRLAAVLGTYLLLQADECSQSLLRFLQLNTIIIK